MEGRFDIFVDHWRAGDDAIREELMRLASMAYERGVANADWAMVHRLERLGIDAHSEASFRRTLESQLDELAEFRKKVNRHPFGLLSGVGLEYLAERFATAYLSGTEPEQALALLRGVDERNVHVQYLADGVCQAEVRRRLLRLAELGYEVWLNGTRPNRDTDEKATEQAMGEAERKAEGVPADTSTAPADNTPADFVKHEKRGGRDDLMNRVHGFPLASKLCNTAVNILHTYMLREKMIDGSVPSAEIAALFSDVGPSGPINFLASPGKLVMLFRCAGILGMSESEEYPQLNRFNQQELNNFGHWLNPRLVGTFRNGKGERFTTRQLTKAANRMMPDVHGGKAWFLKMMEELDSAINHRSNRNT